MGLEKGQDNKIVENIAVTRKCELLFCLLFFFNKNYLDLHMTTAETSGKHCLYLSESRAVVEIDKVMECSRRYAYGN